MTEQERQAIIAAGGDPHKPDLYIIMRTKFEYGYEWPIGRPIAVFKNKPSEERMKRIADQTDSKFGIQVWEWWFDD